MNENVTVLIPAHNEAKTIRQTIKSVFNQSTKPNKVIVICDNCTDSTEYIAEMMRIKFKRLEVFVTKGNTHKKAGALNQVLKNFDVLDEFILVMDADTILDQDVLKEGMRYFSKNQKLGAVCSKAGVMECDKNSFLYKKFIWNLQKLEYSMFDTHRIETFNRIKVCHGMCTLYKKEGLIFTEQYHKEKFGLSQVYLESNLVEDYELTLCIKHKYEVTSNLNMLAWTDVPLSLKELWIQRNRWFRGGVDCMLMHGYNNVTKPEILGHLLFFVIVSLQITLIIMSIFYINKYGFHMGLDWIFISLIILGYCDTLYRLKYVWNLKVTDVIIRILLLPEFVYRWFQIVSMLYSYYLSFFRIKQSW